MNTTAEKLMIEAFLMDSKLKELKKQIKAELEKDTKQMVLKFSVKEQPSIVKEVIKKKA